MSMQTGDDGQERQRQATATMWMRMMVMRSGARFLVSHEQADDWADGQSGASWQQI